MPNQKTLVVHCKEVPYDVYIGRGSKWGNPFTHLPLQSTKAQFQVADREESIRKYEAWFLSQPVLVKALPELKGKILGCFCKPLSCHGDILAHYADNL